MGDVFDIEKVGIWLALGDISVRGMDGWGNLHFGYDPTKDRLVPLLWDMANENNQASPTNHLSARLIRVTDPANPNSPFWVELLGDDLILESYAKFDTLTTPVNTMNCSTKQNSCSILFEEDYNLTILKSI